MNRIGMLLPRSTDYPAMGMEILGALKASLKRSGVQAEFVTENIGFGENEGINYAKAEKLFLQDEAELIVAYCNPVNAQGLYQLAQVFGKPIIFLDAGMQMPPMSVHALCFHLSLQGMLACRHSGQMAGNGNRQVLMAASFYEGGYHGPWSYEKGLSMAGGSVCGNYVSGYKIAEFSIEPFIGLLSTSTPGCVTACFSSYLAELFFAELKKQNGKVMRLPYYCSPFMAEEELLRRSDFPGGELHTVVPWASSLESSEQEAMRAHLSLKNGSRLSLFHLLGWEAGIVTSQILQSGPGSLKGFHFESPRGKVRLHPETHYSYAPLYEGYIREGEGGKCRLEISRSIEVSPDEHQIHLTDSSLNSVSGWKNNYLCI